MRMSLQKPKPAQQAMPVTSSNYHRTNIAQNRVVPSTYHLQSTIGNQDVQRFLQANAAEFKGGSLFEHDFSRIPIFSSPPVKIQPKLTVNLPGDEYEREADRVAQQIMDMGHLTPSDNQHQTIEKGQAGIPLTPMAETIPPIMSRRDAQKNEAKVHTECNTCQEEQSMAISPDLESAIHRERGTGTALEDNVRKPMQQVFGTDFSHVRIHSDQMSDKLSNQLQARAFTAGNDIFFRKGEYQPETGQGNKLLAHELTHVVQQNSSKTGLLHSIQRFDLVRILIGAGLVGLAGCSRHQSTGQLPPLTEAGLREAQRQFNQAHGRTFSDIELQRINHGFEAIFRRGDETNLRLWITILNYYATYPLQKLDVPPDTPSRMITRGNYRTTIYSSVFTRETDASIATMILHEYSHLRVSPRNEALSTEGVNTLAEVEAPMSAGARLLEADNYAIEWFFAERARDNARLIRVFPIYLTANNVAVAGEQEFQEIFIGTYGTLKCLYEIIDNGASAHASTIPELRSLTRDDAYRLVQELVEMGSDYIRTTVRIYSIPAIAGRETEDRTDRNTLRAIHFGVINNRDRFPIQLP